MARLLQRQIERMCRRSRPPGVTVREWTARSEFDLSACAEHIAASFPPSWRARHLFRGPERSSLFRNLASSANPAPSLGMTPKTALLTSVEFAKLPYRGGNTRHSQRAAGWPTRSDDDVVPPEDLVPKEAEVPLANGRIWCGPMKHGTDTPSFKVALQNQAIAVFVAHDKSPSRRWTLLE